MVWQWNHSLRRPVQSWKLEMRNSSSCWLPIHSLCGNWELQPSLKYGNQQKTQGSWHLSRSMPPLSVSNASLFPCKWWMLCRQSVSCGACIWLNWRIMCVQHFFLCWWRLWYQFPFWKLLLPVSLESTVCFPATTSFSFNSWHWLNSATVHH